MGFTSPSDQRQSVAAATGMLTGLAGAAHQVGNDELGPFFTQLDDLARQIEAARVALLGEAIRRGVVAQSHHAHPTG